MNYCKRLAKPKNILYKYEDENDGGEYFRDGAWNKSANYPITKCIHFDSFGWKIISEQEAILEFPEAFPEVQQNNFKYCLIYGVLFRYVNPSDNGEQWSTNRWLKSTSPSIEDSKIKQELTEFEAIEQFPEAFQEPELKYCLHGGWLYYYTDENDLGTYWRDGRWNKSEMQPPVSFLIKDNRAKEITKEQAMQMFPEAFQENNIHIPSY